MSTESSRAHAAAATAVGPRLLLPPYAWRWSGRKRHQQISQPRSPPPIAVSRAASWSLRAFAGTADHLTRLRSQDAVAVAHQEQLPRVELKSPRRRRCNCRRGAATAAALCLEMEREEAASTGSRSPDRRLQSPSPERRCGRCERSPAL